MPHRDMRRGLLESVSFDLLGPVAADEILFDYRVRDRYLLGMLATDGTVAVDPTQADEEDPDVDKGAAEAHDEGDDRSSARPMLFPSSLGVSFAVEQGVSEVAVEVSWGEYSRVDNPTPIEERPDWQQSDRHDRCWRRSPRQESVRVELTEGAVGPYDLPGQHGPVRVSGTCRTASTGCKLVTLFLHNKQTEPGSNADEAWLFQPQLVLTGTNGAPVFVGRAEAIGITAPDPTIDPDAAERATLDMQYRRRVEFARGHAVAVSARSTEDDPTRCGRIATTFLPQHEVRKTSPASPSDRPELSGLVTDMQQLASMEADKLRQALVPLSDGYAQWLAAQSQRVDEDPTLAPHREAAEEVLYEAELVAQAIREGIDMLQDGSDALAAFRFANRAMAQQRLRTDAVQTRRDGRHKDDDLEDIVEAFASDLTEDGENTHTRWRPFQLAFVLLNLPALIDPAHGSRSSSSATVDLIFFPTGGGKTEAYLGLVAVAFAARRLSPTIGDVDGSDGVIVLMRYTLRLLTAQQFERAAALVCATEAIRREDPSLWGETPFRLGMWVGGSLTPNRTGSAIGGNARSGAAEAIERLRQRRTPPSGSPHQLAACPWCGAALDPAADPRHIYAADDPGDDAEKYNPNQRTLTYCPDELCQFGKLESEGEGIPVITVDDEIYRLLPAFIIGTIDKFAQLPWNPQVRMLFGRVHDRCPSHGWRGPDETYRPKECHSPTGHVSTSTIPATEALSAGCDRLRPPDLVIQDEFHLITGPLGTMAGLYETAIDRLSSWTLDETTVRPKVVASTATIRRAQDQARAVFARDTRIFPPQVLDVDDTFFARETPLEDSPGRLYVGVCASGRRLKEAESRLFRTVMAAAQHQWDLAEPSVPAGQPNPADPWMTTVGYFSAIRELAGMYRIATEELPSRLRKVEADRRDFLGTRFAREFTLPDGTRKRLYYDLEPVELTSRVGAADLRDVLDELFVRHDYQLEAAPKTKAGWRVIRQGIDLVLATNMISVGVDVSRLGMMVVVGQPKTTAEYIQASSRVGRSYDNAPGVVFTLASWTRPRDLSHWEQFEHYHDTFYRNVEAQSVTPFAPRALDRGATGVMVSLLRGAVDGWAPDRGLADITAGAPDLNAAVSALAERAVEAQATSPQVEAAKAAAQDRADKLTKKVADASTTYAWRARGKNAQKDGLTTLLHSAEDANGEHPWVMPNSLRNTEPAINILIDREVTPPADPAWDWSNVKPPPAHLTPADSVDDVDDPEAEEQILADLTGEDA